MHRRSNIIIVLICMQRRKGNEEERPIRVGRCQRGRQLHGLAVGRSHLMDTPASHLATGLIDVAKTNILRSWQSSLIEVIHRVIALPLHALLTEEQVLHRSRDPEI